MTIIKYYIPTIIKTRKYFIGPDMAVQIKLNFNWKFLKFKNDQKQVRRAYSATVMNSRFLDVF